MEKGREQQIKPTKGKKQQLEPDNEDWDEVCRNEVVNIMETEVPERVVMQVAQKRPKLPVPRLIDDEEMSGNKVTPARKRQSRKIRRKREERKQGGW